MTWVHHCDASYGLEVKTTSSPKPTLKSKKTKKSDGTTPEVTDITKPGGDEVNIQLRHAKDQELQDSILPGETSPVVELDKINSAEGGRDMPPPDAPGPIIPTYAPDKETRAATETLEALQRQQPTAGLPKGSSLLTPPGEADYFEGEGLMVTLQQSQRRQKMHSAPISQLSALNTQAGSISTITVGILPPSQSVGRRFNKSQPKGLPNLLQIVSKGVGKQTTSELTDSHPAGGLGGTKNNQASSSKPKVLTMHSSGPGSSGGAAGGSGQDPNEPRQEVSHLALIISDGDEFTDNSHQILPPEDAFALSYLPRQTLEGFNWGYLLQAEVTAF